MKKMKSGFTLAEVLITLGIIGVVAAIVMPSVVSSYQYKTVGVKLSKFASQLEGAARPFVVNNGNFTDDENGTDLLQAFLQESFLITNSADLEEQDGTFDGITATAPEDQGGTEDGANKVLEETTGDNGNGFRILELKDGTALIAYQFGDAGYVLDNTPPDGADFDNRQVGDAMFAVRFAPNVQGLPRNAQQSYDFVVTELGFVYPHQDDTCLAGIVDNNYVTNARTYSNSVCSNSDRNSSGS